MPTGLINPDTEGQTHYEDPALASIAAHERGKSAADDGAPSNAIDMSDFENDVNSSQGAGDNDINNPNSATNAEQSAVASQPDDGILGKGFTGKNKKRKTSGFRRRTAITIGGITFVLGLGGFAVVSPMLAPLHWLHYAQGLHILDESSDETSSLSITKLYRYYKTRDFNRTRLSFLQNQKHDAFVAKLAEAGIHITPRANGRATNVIEFDIEKSFPELAGKPQADIDAALKKQFGKGIETTLGKNGSAVRVSMKNATARAANKLMRFVAKASGDNALDTALIKWHGKTYFNIPDLFHPERRVDNKFLKIIDKIFPASAKAREAGKTGKSAWEKFKEGDSFKGFAKAAGGLLIAQMAACTVREAAAKITEIQHEAIVVPGQIFALQTVSYASQLTSDSPDVQAEALSTMTESLYKDGKTPMDSNAFRSLQGESSTAQYDSKTTATTEQIKNAFSPTSPDKLTTNAIDQVQFEGHTLCSPEAMVTTAVIGIGLLIASIPTTGGTASVAIEGASKIALSFAVGFAFGAILDAGTDYVSKLLAGEMPEVANQGVLGGELTVNAYESVVNSSEASVGGVVASSQTKAALSNDIAETKADKINSQTAYSRFIDLKNGDSLLGRLVDKISPSPKDNLSNVASAFMNIGQSIIKLPTNLLAKRTVYAAKDNNLVSSYDAVSAIDDVDKNEEDVAAIYDSSDGQYYRDKVLQCTGNQISWNDDGGYWDVNNVSQVDTTTIAYLNNCANDTLLNDKKWTEIRASLKYTSTLEHLYCVKLNDDDSCNRSDVGSTASTLSSSSDTTTDTSDAVGPATLKRSQGKWGGYTNGDIPTSALTKITPSDFPGNSSSACDHQSADVPSLPYFNPSAYISLKALNDAYMKDTGKSTGLILLSCYRDKKGQKKAKATQGSNAATPGTSNHGWGLAVDFDNTSTYDSATYKWLMENAAKYGWVNPPNMQKGGSGPHEPWHWEYARPISSGSSSI